MSVFCVCVVLASNEDAEYNEVNLTRLNKCRCYSVILLRKHEGLLCPSPEGIKSHIQVTGAVDGGVGLPACRRQG